MLKKLANILKQNSLKIAVAESCTAGNLAAKLTSISGSSQYFDRGYITYSNQAKKDMLGILDKTLSKYGAVSEEIALEMLIGVKKNANADIAISITGIAGPTGGSINKPVGTVCFGFSTSANIYTTTKFFKGSRQDIISQSVDYCIAEVYKNFNS